MLKRVLVVLVLAGLFAVSIAEISSADDGAHAPRVSGAAAMCPHEHVAAPEIARAVASRLTRATD